MNKEERKFHSVSRGKESELLLKLFGNRIEEHKKKSLDLLKSKFRNGERDAVTLASGLSAYCAIEDLEAELSREVTQGNKSSQEIHGTSEPGKPERS